MIFFNLEREIGFKQAAVAFVPPSVVERERGPKLEGRERRVSREDDDRIRRGRAEHGIAR